MHEIVWARLTGSTGLTDSRSYQYDLDGNRTRRVEASVTTDVTYDRADQVQQQEIAGTPRTFTYDRYGNLTQGADAASAYTSYAYDEANRLTAITPPTGGQVTFTLDALDRHATRSVGGTLADTYSYLDATETAWQTGTGSPTSALLDADGSRLAVKTGAAVAWLIFDLHGSVTALCTAGTSTITDAYRFDGFGQQIASAGTAANPWRFRGLLNIGADSLTGALLDMGARDYSPGLGVFTQEDSVQGAAANPLTMNRFLYALANPATLIDPDGHNACLDVGGGCVASGSTVATSSSTTTVNFNSQLVRNQQTATRRAVRITQEREVTGCRQSGICSTMEGAPPPGFHWSSFAINGQPTILPDGWCGEVAGDASSDCSGPDAAGAAATLSGWVLTGAEGATHSREWASELGRCLRVCTDAAARSKAASLLRAAGTATAFGRSAFYKRFAGKLPLIGLGVEFGLNIAEGQDPVEAGLRAGGSAGGSAIGGGAGVLLCGALALAAPACIGVVFVLVWAGSEAGEEVGGELYDRIDQP